jgi:hypothetical protein
MLTKTQIVALIQTADRHGSAYALRLLTDSQEGLLDTPDDPDEDGWEDWDAYEDDLRDLALLCPRINGAGERPWM